MPYLRLTCLGPPAAWLNEQLLTFPTRKSLALLIYLAVEADLPFVGRAVEYILKTE